MVDYMEHHCKTYVMRLDVHLPKELQQNGISKFNHRFIEKEKNRTRYEKREQKNGEIPDGVLDDVGGGAADAGSGEV